jgi:hypothetical protein
MLAIVKRGVEWPVWIEGDHGFQNIFSTTELIKPVMDKSEVHWWMGLYA